MKRFIRILLALAFLPCVAPAKRAATTKAEPVIYRGVRYVAPNDDGRRGYIEAWDLQTNRKLWDLTVFTNRIDPKLEEDVQWVFIDKLSVRDGELLVSSENGKVYRVDLKTKAVTQSDPEVSQAPRAAVELRDIPEVVKNAITNGSLAKNCDISFQIEPFYLEWDFNGDGKIDVAVPVKQRSTGKLGIAIVHAGTGNVPIVGAGIPIGNGGDDFEWMDSWQLYSKNRAAHAAGEAGARRLHSDALLVSKSEAASALIYWNGKRYVWLQQGD
jgi:hypothetical protein